MTLADDVNLEEFVMTKDEFSGADIKAICTEAGLLALRERRMKVTNSYLKIFRMFHCPMFSGSKFFAFVYTCILSPGLLLSKLYCSFYPVLFCSVCGVCFMAVKHLGLSTSSLQILLFCGKYSIDQMEH